MHSLTPYEYMQRSELAIEETTVSWHRVQRSEDIRESVDSLCRDGADTDTPIYQMKRLITPERYSYKPFQTYNKAL